MIVLDESQIVIGNDNRVYICRKGDETFQPDCICPGVNRKISVMIWVCISYNGVGTLTKVDGTINATKYFQIWTAVCGQSLPGTSQMVIIVFRMAMLLFIGTPSKASVEENEIKTIEWPAQSPDSNIIENVWLKIKIELQKMSETVDSRNQLYENILQIWTNI